jgi:3-oxoacyl-[acyl-carrier-protein] synthase II
VVTGLGPVSPIGNGAELFWSAIRSGQSHVENRTLAVDLGAMVDLPISTMPDITQLEGVEKHLETLASQEMERYRELIYSLLAIDLALADAELSFDSEHNRIGMIQAFEAPGVECTVSDMFTMFATPPPGDGPPRVYEHLARRFYNMQPFMYVHVVGKAFGFRGFCTNVHNACATGAFALETAAQRIADGHADVMVVVGGEAFDTAVRLEWFRRLQLYAAAHQMRPFDSNPSGFYVGEGATALILESATHAEARGAEPYARYLGASFAHQAWKQTLPDLRSARLRDVITTALDRTSTSPADVDLVVPHAACTSLSDNYEATCLAESLGEEANGAMLAAFKPNFGHMLAASGLMEVTAGLLALRHQVIPPTLNTLPDRMVGQVPISSQALERRVDTLLKLSTGFTGHDAATLFRRA